jgi:hypothetical protein
MIPYRVFICYSHDKTDEELVRQIGENLEQEGLTVMWDQEFSVGQGFHDKIKSLIAHSHVFLPIITESCSERGWFLQEIGYALANNIPILPLAIDGLPDAMVRELQAIVVPRDFEKIQKELKYEIFSNLIRRYENPRYATYQFAESSDDRALLMTKYARDVLEIQKYGKVRQKGGLSSFQIPNKIISDPIWKRRYGSLPKGAFHAKLRRNERLVLEKLASVAGCKIIIDPTFLYDVYDPAARKNRLESLRDFLKSFSGNKAQVAFYNEKYSQNCVTIVGNWFYAESHAGKQGKGYHQTFFTRHAPSIQHRIDLFDQEFSVLLKNRGWNEDNCRDRALEEIDEIIAEISFKNEDRASEFKYREDLEHFSEDIPEVGIKKLLEKVNIQTTWPVQTPIIEKIHENAQFTVYRPSAIIPEKWHSFLFFAHLAERPKDAKEDEPDPLEEVERQAREILHDEMESYSQLRQDSSQPLPKEGQLTIAPHIEGIVCNPPEKTFYWYEPVHREIFRIKTTKEYTNKICRGGVSVYFGNICVAEIPISIKITAELPAKSPTISRNSAQVYRKIFASYSRKDENIVKEFEHFAQTTGDKFLRDVQTLRTGEIWSERIPELIMEADIFQLFWSNNSMYSPYVRQEWEFALTLRKPNFIRPVYWNDRLPEDKEKKLPPPELRKFHFHQLRTGSIITLTHDPQNSPNTVEFEDQNDLITTKEFRIEKIKSSLDEGINLFDSLDTRNKKISKINSNIPINVGAKDQIPAELSGQYLASKYIGRGGFARVFKATKRDGKTVAIKVPISIDPSTARMFLSEIQNWTKLVHENIVKIYDYNLIPPYIEMELCDESLANLKKPILNEEAAWLIYSICEGLKYAHTQNIIHRDLKPQNILLKNGVPKISDWGLSRVLLSNSTTNPTSLTVCYASPEQVNNRKQDARTDLWQLGVIFYELTSGTLPFKSETVTDTIIAIATQNPVQPSSINPEAKDLDCIIMRCLEKDPARRYQTVAELQKDLATYLIRNIKQKS